MADEALRMRAEVVDRFSGPLKRLRAELLDTSRQGAAHGETLAKGFVKAENALQSTARTASTVVNPAFAALGVTSLGAGAAILGIQGALSKLTGNLTGLGSLSRETGIAAQALSNLSGVASRFGVDQSVIGGAAKAFAGNMREVSRHTGETFQWLNRQGTNPESRRAFQNFTADLERTKDSGDALRKSLEFMETIQDPTERGMFSQKLFGTDALGPLGDKHLGRIGDLLRKQQEKTGIIDPASILNAEKFDKAAEDLKSSVSKVGRAIATELMGPATQFTTWIDELVSGQRKDFTEGLRKGIGDIRAELEKINWHEAGEGAKDFLVNTTSLAGKLASAVKEIAASIKAINEGNYAGAARGLDGASGPLARKLAPRVGDDEIAAKEQVESWKKALGEAEIDQETGGPAIDFKSREPYLKQKLKESEDELNRLQARTPDQRQRDFEGNDKLRRSIDNLSETIKGRDGATAQKSSAEGDGPFAGARVQTASLGGLGGGFGLGYRGARPEPMPVPESYRRGGGGRFNPLGGSGGAVESPPLPKGPVLDPNSPAGQRVAPFDPQGGVRDGTGNYTGNDGRRAAQGRLTEGGRARIASWMDYLQRPIADGGLGMPKGKAQATIAMMQGESGLNLDPGIIGDSGHAHGTAQWSDQRGNQRFPLLRRYADSQRKPWQDVGVQQQYHRMEMLGLPGAISHRQAYDAMMNAPSDEETLRQGIKRYENPQKHDLAYQLRKPFLDRLRRDGASPGVKRADGGNELFNADGTPKVLRPNSMGGAPGVTMDEANAMRGGKADGEAWNRREQARKLFESQKAEAEDLRLGNVRLSAAARNAGVLGGGKTEANGSVSVVVREPGPNTNVRTSASGELFKTIAIQHARPRGRPED